MKVFITAFLLVLSVNVLAQHRSERIYPVACDGSSMISNQGRVIYQFMFSTDCGQSLLEANVNNGRFCDDETLVRANGTIAHNFTFSSDCQNSLRQIGQSRVGLFCDDETLIHVNRGIVANMSFNADCDTAILHASWYRGRFCNDGIMMDYMGNILGDYGMSTSCRYALQRLPR